MSREPHGRTGGVTRRRCLAQFSAGLIGAGGVSVLTALAADETSRPLSKRGRETREFKDPLTGRVIRQLTDHRTESKHSYYDVCPWSRDGALLVFSSADPGDLTTPDGDSLSTRRGQICVMDMKTFEISVIAEDGFYSTHTGAFPLWHPLKKVIYYRRGPESIGAIDLDAGKRWTMSGVLRQLSPDGRRFASYLNRSDRPDQPEAWGVYTMNEDGSQLKQVVSLQRLYELTPNRDEFRLEDMTIGNTKWAPDSRHLLVAMWVHPKPQARRSIYVVNAESVSQVSQTRPEASPARWLTHFGHHHSWTPDGKQVLFNDWRTTGAEGASRDSRMFLVNLDGSGRRVVIDQAVGSHPLMDPGGTMIADFDGKGVFLVLVKEQRVERLAAFRKPFDMSHKGTHPHCVWNRDGTQILYNSAETGHSEIYLVSARG